jgi:ectoine hydroxylase-related dioxygenase (phytanoyl-CoA dioxygenase family)
MKGTSRMSTSVDNPHVNQLASRFLRFGFVLLEKELCQSLDQIESHVTQMAALSRQMAPNTRATVFNLFERCPDLRQLLVTPRVKQVVAQILGDSPIEFGSESNLLVGSSHWHSDYQYEETFIKAAVYLEETKAENGALRIFQFSHTAMRNANSDELTMVIEHSVRMGLRLEDVPCFVVPSRPGDLILFDPNALHAALAPVDTRRQVSFLFARRSSDPLHRRNLVEKLLRRHMTDRFVSLVPHA